MQYTYSFASHLILVISDFPHLEFLRFSFILWSILEIKVSQLPFLFQYTAHCFTFQLFLMGWFSTHCWELVCKSLHCNRIQSAMSRLPSQSTLSVIYPVYTEPGRQQYYVKNHLLHYWYSLFTCFQLSDKSYLISSVPLILVALPWITKT